MTDISFFGYIIPFLILLTIVVFIHEMGHFLVGRWCGVKIEIFSVGFGRPILSRKDKHGTIWQLGWIPLGGYVKFFGDEDAASTPSAQKLSDEQAGLSLHHKPIWQKSAVVAAGPIANFILGILIFAGIAFFMGERITPAIIGTVQEESAAARAGFQPNDKIIMMNDAPVAGFSEIARKVSVSAGTEIRFTVERAGQNIILTATPEPRIERDRFGNEYSIGRLGVSSTLTQGEHVQRIEHGFFSALGLGVKESYFIVEQSLVMLGRVITGRESADSLGGPVRIAQISGQVASLGLLAFLNLTAVLSISIGLINLFPLPVLDGGHLLFYTIEAIIRRPIPEMAYAFAMRAGMVFLLFVFVMITWQDLARIGLFQ